MPLLSHPSPHPTPVPQGRGTASCLEASGSEGPRGWWCPAGSAAVLGILSAVSSAVCRCIVFERKAIERHPSSFKQCLCFRRKCILAAGRKWKISNSLVPVARQSDER